MKNNNTVKNIKVTCRNKVVRMTTARPDQLMVFLHASVGTVITGEQDGKKVCFEYISGQGFSWVEVK